MATEEIFVALYQYEAQGEEELSFQAGEQIIILHKQDDWWYGSLNSQKGWFSPLFGEILQNKPKKPPPPQRPPPGGNSVAAASKLPGLVIKPSAVDAKPVESQVKPVGSQAKLTTMSKPNSPMQLPDISDSKKQSSPSPVKQAPPPIPISLPPIAVPPPIPSSSSTTTEPRQVSSDSKRAKSPPAKVSKVVSMPDPSPSSHLQHDSLTSLASMVSIDHESIDGMYADLPEGERLRMRATVMNDISKSEEVYCNRLRGFERCIRVLSEQRGGDKFAGEIMSNPGVSTVFRIYKDIVAANDKLLSELRQYSANTASNAETENVVATHVSECFRQFGPSLRLYAQFISSSSDALNAIHKRSSELSDFLRQHPLPPPLTFEQYLMLPIQRYPEYVSLLEQIMALTPHSAEACRTAAEAALMDVNQFTQEVDAVLQAEEDRMELLSLQSKFVGNNIECLDIYAPTRRLVYEGELRKVNTSSPAVNEGSGSAKPSGFRLFKSSDTPSSSTTTEADIANDKSCFVHLFNDRIIWSKQVGQSNFKPQRNVTLVGAFLVDIPKSTMFELSWKNRGTSIDFSADAQAMAAIQAMTAGGRAPANTATTTGTASATSGSALPKLLKGRTRGSAPITTLTSIVNSASSPPPVQASALTGPLSVNAGSAKVVRFRAETNELKRVWMEHIYGVLRAVERQAVSQGASMASAHSRKPSMRIAVKDIESKQQNKQLVGRSQIVYKFVKDEGDIVEAMEEFMKLVLYPLSEGINSAGGTTTPSPPSTSPTTSSSGPRRTSLLGVLGMGEKATSPSTSSSSSSSQQANTGPKRGSMFGGTASGVPDELMRDARCLPFLRTQSMQSAFGVTVPTASSGSTPLVARMKLAGALRSLSTGCPDITVFIRVYSELHGELVNVVEALEQMAMSNDWKDDGLKLPSGPSTTPVTVCYGNAFNRQSMIRAFDSFASCAEQCINYVTTQTQFAPFLSECIPELNHSQNDGPCGNWKVSNFVSVPLDTPERYVRLITSLLDHTASTHPDFRILSQSCEQMMQLFTAMKGNRATRQSLDELRRVRNCLIFAGFSENYSFVETLISENRQLIKEGNLDKVCRNKTKTFRFWLFNDAIMYGSQMIGDKYAFHRALRLEVVNVSPNKAGDALSFDIVCPAKSFTVKCVTKADRDEWVDAIANCRARLMDTIMSSNGPTTAVATTPIVAQSSQPRPSVTPPNLPAKAPLPLSSAGAGLGNGAATLMSTTPLPQPQGARPPPPPPKAGGASAGSAAGAKMPAPPIRTPSMRGLAPLNAVPPPRPVVQPEDGDNDDVPPTGFLADIRKGKQLNRITSVQRRHISARFSRNCDTLMQDVLMKAMDQRRIGIAGNSRQNEDEDSDNDDEWSDDD